VYSTVKLCTFFRPTEILNREWLCLMNILQLQDTCDIWVPCLFQNLRCRGHNNRYRNPFTRQHYY
jgi:hypothetical protein